MLNSKILFFIGLTIIGSTTILYLDYSDKDFNLHEILVEFHGLIFDLIIFGLLLTIYDSIKSRQDRIVRYKEEISDYSGWESEEAKHRISGLVKRLIQLKVKKIELYNCHIIHCPYTKKMIDWKFATAKLYNSHFIACDLTKSTFYLSELHDVSFSSVDLTDCDFGMAILDDCYFNKCIFTNTTFNYAYVSEQDWYEQIIQDENIGVEILKEKYIISSNSITMNSKKYYQIFDKALKKTIAVDREIQKLENIKNFRPRMPF